jgi:hypothetical protein
VQVHKRVCKFYKKDDKMRVITAITTNSKLNAKAADLALLVRLYDKCLFPTDEIFNNFIEQLQNTIDSLNKQYTRTKPFELYRVWEHGITITVTGRPDVIVSHLALATIKVFASQDSINPIKDLILINKNED